MTKALQDTVALVTGASSGIGEATARALSEQGATVAVIARRKDRLDALAAEIGGLAIETDVTEREQAVAAVDRAARERGRLDIGINNAGVMLLGPIVDADTEDWRRMVNTNVLGLMYLTHAAVPGMLEQGAGEIVNISSVAGRQARVGAGVYNASKWAVNAFSESLRQEVTAKGVRISLVEPGAVATELVDHITHPGAKQGAEKMRESMRELQSEDIANAILYVVTQPAHVAINEVLIRPTDQVR